ncbi:MAG: pimeloyl-[acyl-carrier protein] methyl ester esterase [Betaproteobacteria bacterium]|nr:MAG: pimeloyl-[acyl-carrier protein] methyl ester esterase [Betaproteobacteria bacterium]
MKSVAVNQDRPALVLLHGWGTHGGVWDDLIARLGNDAHVLAPDLPGHGAVPALAPYTIEHIVDQLASAVPRHCVVAGWSLGGQLALAWARRHPQQVAKLILIATTPRFVSATDWPHGMAADVLDEFAAALARDAPTTLRRFLLLETRGDTQSRAVARRLDAALAARPLPDAAVLAQTLHWLQVTDLRDELHTVGQPTLILHGDRDRITPRAAGDYLAAHLRCGRLKRIAGAAHAPFISNPQTVGQLMADFCND